ncbi:hypothetical protein LguiB_034791 [Lonicera macranthoides]
MMNTMNSDSKPMFVHGIESINSNSTIPDLISFTRSAFRPSDFDLVQRILIDRESNMKKEYDLKEKKHAEAVLVHLEMEVEFEKCKQEVESLRKVEREKNDLIFQLNEEIKELKCSKGRADLKVEAGKRKFEELEQRVGRLEEDVTALGGQFPPTPEQNDLQETGTPAYKTPIFRINPNIQSDLHSLGKACGNGEMPIRNQLVSKSGSSDKIMGSSKPQFGDIIQIDDSDDEKPVGDGMKSVSNVRSSDFISSEDKERRGMEKSLLASNHKRKRSSQSVYSSSDDDAGKLDSIASHKSVFIRHCNEKPVAKRNSQVVLSNSDSDDASDSGDENYSDSCIESMIDALRRKKEIRG